MNKLFKFTPNFLENTQRLKREDAKLLGKLWQIIGDIQEQPFTGIGKPEGLKGNLSGYWSRRITERHRLLYKVFDDMIILYSCFDHYTEDI